MTWSFGEQLEFWGGAMSDMKVVAKCPKCGSHDIREWNTAASRSHVMRWVVEDGGLQPADWEHDDPEWETDEEMGPYECADCGKNCGIDALVIEEVPDDD